jgi:2,3-bisphosphoglycerate-independent phosphoglycerate mutase
VKPEARGIILIGDGMGGRPIPQLNGKTSLEAQDTPSLDSIAREGECGLMDPISPGRAAGSDTSHMALLGYDPFKYYRGRGPFEARGVGIDVEPGDVAFRCNFATVEGRRVVDRRAGRIKSGTGELAAAISEGEGEIAGVRCIFEPSVEHRAALVLRGEGLSHEITEVDPHEAGVDYWDARPLDNAEDPAAAKQTAVIVNEFVRRSHEILENHPVNQARRQRGELPANIVLPRGSGTAVHLQPLEQRYGLRSAMIVEVDLVRGLGEYLKMDVIRVPGATGGQDTDEMAIAGAIVQALDDHDFVLANIKAPDLGGHDGNYRAKMEAIAKVDRAAGYLLQNVDFAAATMAVTADHSTPCTAMDHTGDPVPIAFYGVGLRPDDVTSFGERPCAKGSMGRIRGMDLMNLITNYMGASEKFGA